MTFFVTLIIFSYFKLVFYTVFLWSISSTNYVFQAHEGAHGRSDRHVQHVGAGAAVPLLQDARRRRQQQARRMRTCQVTHSLARYVNVTYVDNQLYFKIGEKVSSFDTINASSRCHLITVFSPFNLISDYSSFQTNLITMRPADKPCQRKRSSRMTSWST